MCARRIGKAGRVVHPDRPGPGISPIDDECDDLARCRVVDSGNLQIRRPAHSVGSGVGYALMLWHRDEIGVPGVGPQPRIVVDRKAEVIARGGSRIGALELILVIHRGPHSGKVESHPRLGRTGSSVCREQYCKGRALAKCDPMHTVFHTEPIVTQAGQDRWPLRRRAISWGKHLRFKEPGLPPALPSTTSRHTCPFRARSELRRLSGASNCKSRQV